MLFLILQPVHPTESTLKLLSIYKQIYLYQIKVLIIKLISIGNFPKNTKHGKCLIPSLIDSSLQLNASWDFGGPPCLSSQL